MDMSQPVGGSGSERNGLLLNSQPYTTQVTLTTELELTVVRFPVGVLRANFRVIADLSFVCTNNANVKTIRAYFGNSANTALEGGTICGTQALTSSAGANFRFIINGRLDNTTIDSQSIGAAGGWGISTTAPITVSTNAVFGGPAAQEQALVISYQKATAADALQLMSERVELFY